MQDQSNTDAKPVLTRGLLLLLAAGTGVGVSTLYLSQPILHLLGESLHAGTQGMGVVTMVTQLGYALGIFFLLPLGDVLLKRRLILVKLLIMVASLAAVGLVQNHLQLVATSLFLGVCASVAQDFVPLAAELAEPRRRGAAIGTVMSGLLLGILLSRTFSGVIADFAGWRMVFFAGAAAALVLTVLTYFYLPVTPRKLQASYGSLLRSMGGLLQRYPEIALSTVGQGFLGLVFSAFWTVLAFHLSGPPFNLSASAIGLFAIIGAGGTIFAPIVGRLADRYGPLFNIRCGIGLISLSFLSLFAWPYSMPVLIAATVLFDLGLQLGMISHQTIVYSLDDNARSRINAIFISGIFLFFAVGSITASTLYELAGWRGVVGLCLASCACATVLHVLLTRQLSGGEGAGVTCAEANSGA